MSKDTIQARILRALTILVLAITAVSGVSLYAIFQARISWQESVQEPTSVLPVVGKTKIDKTVSDIRRMTSSEISADDPSFRKTGSGV